jgi:hypothetical protein
MKPPPQVRITQRAYALAVTLYDAGAAAAEIPVMHDMTGPAFSELAIKGVAKPSGLTKGRYGKPGFVRLTIGREQLVVVPNRTSRKPTIAATQPRGESRALTIGEFEAFVQRFHEAREPLLAEQSRAIGARIAELQRYLAVAVGDDFRNTMAMTNVPLRELDDVAHSVDAEVIACLKPDAGSPLFPVWRAMA